MKKTTVTTGTFTMAAIVALLLCLLTSCGTTKALVSTPDPTANAMAIYENDDTRSSYLSEYKKRLEVMESDDTVPFLSEDEKQLIEEKGFTFSNTSCTQVYSVNEFNPFENSVLFYPLAWERDGEVEVIGIDETGHLYSSLEHRYYDIHTDSSAPKLMRSPFSTLTYEDETGTIQLWSFGELKAEGTVPANSVYAGHSFWEGYIFRKDSNVYSVKVDEETQEIQSEVIAHRVQQVLATDYDYSSDCWSQPLFLMKDGSVKVYVGSNDAKPDDAKQLFKVESEGEDSKVYFPYK